MKSKFITIILLCFAINTGNFDPEKWAKLFKNSGTKYMIDSSKQKLSIKMVNDGVTVSIPKNLRAELAKQDAVVIRLVNE